MRRNTSSSRSLRHASGESPADGRAAGHLAEQPARHPVADVDLAGQHPAQRDQHLLGRLLLHQVGARAGAQRPLGVERLVVHRQDHHRDGDVAGAEVLDQLEAVGSVQREVDDGDVGLQRVDAVERRGGVGGLAADLEVGLLVDELGQAAAHDRVIVNDEDAGFHRHPSRVSTAKRARHDRVPRRALDARELPPIMAAR